MYTVFVEKTQRDLLNTAAAASSGCGGHHPGEAPRRANLLRVQETRDPGAAVQAQQDRLPRGWWKAPKWPIGLVLMSSFFACRHPAHLVHTSVCSSWRLQPVSSADKGRILIVIARYSSWRYVFKGWVRFSGSKYKFPCLKSNSSLTFSMTLSK